MNQPGTLAALIGSYALASCCPCFLLLFSGWEDGDLVSRPYRRRGYIRQIAAAQGRVLESAALE
jgi:hypothetical protein